MSEALYVLVFDGFAEWQLTHTLAAVRRWAAREIITVAFEARPVISSGGLRVLPDRLLPGQTGEDPCLLVLPGGDMWAAGAYPSAPLDELLHRLSERAIPIAAICGATTALARAGLLNDRRHTGPTLDDLNAIGSQYKGSALYSPALAVSDREVITANGLGAVEFAREILGALRVVGSADEALWTAIHNAPPAAQGALLGGSAGLASTNIESLKILVDSCLQQLGSFRSTGYKLIVTHATLNFALCAALAKGEIAADLRPYRPEIQIGVGLLWVLFCWWQVGLYLSGGRANKILEQCLSKLAAPTIVLPPRKLSITRRFLPALALPAFIAFVTVKWIGAVLR